VLRVLIASLQFLSERIDLLDREVARRAREDKEVLSPYPDLRRYLAIGLCVSQGLKSTLLRRSSRPRRRAAIGMARPRVGQNARAVDRPRAKENQRDAIEDQAESILDLLWNPVRQNR
jgi:hypothetical protein